MDNTATGTSPAAYGRVIAIQGVLVRARLPLARMGELCFLRDPRGGCRIGAEVVGLDGEDVILSPMGDTRGLTIHAEVIGTGASAMLKVGMPLLGSVIDALGQPLAAVPAAMDGCHDALRDYPLRNAPPDPMRRRVVGQRLVTGIRAIDGLLTLAQGQRVGLFGGAGAGKSSLMTSLIAHADVDVIIIGLIGERGREVRELLEERIDDALRKRVVAVVATSDRPAAERAMAADTATTIAEYFRDQGMRVLLMIDSLTRYARALREMGLAAGEPPVRRGYPPSFFAALPRLLERAGSAEGTGTITGVYTVLTEGDPALDPVAEEATSLLDGHIVLSDTLARRNHFPAIDVLRSRSRLMSAVVDTAHADAAGAVRDALSRLEDTTLLRQVGEYKSGTDRTTDRAVRGEEAILQFLRQDAGTSEPFDRTLGNLRRLLA